MKLCALLFATLPGILLAQTGADLARSLRETPLDPDQCYLVRDFSFVRDDIKLYFNDGYLIFSKPVNGEQISAVFTTGGEDRADGELLLLPPRRDERQSLAKYTRTPNADEHFDTALMTFTDGSARTLLNEVTARGRGKAPIEIGQAIAARWNPVTTSLTESLTQRIVADLLSPVRPGGGFLFVALQNGRLGNFDVLFDPLGDDQILAGQLVQRENTYSYDVWTSFPSRAIRQDPTLAAKPEYVISSYRINASLDTNLRLKATTRATLRVGESPARVFSFGISRAEQVTAARLDGVPVELVFQESARTRALRADENELFLVIAANILAPGSQHELELEHEGDVIVDRGSSVYSVGARSNWYPRLNMEFAVYDLEFRYPKDLTLVTAGDVLEDHTEGETRITRRRTPNPIRVAGFNLGNYARISHSSGGLTVDVYGNRGLDPALAPVPRITVVPQAVRPLYRGGTALPGNQTTTVIQTLPSPDPLGRLEAVAADVAASLTFFSAMFGPPALKTLTVAPIPGTSGQGFPGLIYLSTLSYLEEDQRPQGQQGGRQKTFFSDLMAAHEVAHQWWGNAVSPAGYQDEWMMEALAHYSALMWLEKKRGPAAMQAELTDYRMDLLSASADGGTVDSFGPLTWGYRLESARDPQTWRIITYQKGAWIIHMLRRRLGDERFVAMLAELRRRFENKLVTTQDLQNLVREFAAKRAATGQPPIATVEAVDGFFDSWVRSTGIPSARVRFTTTGRAPSVRVSGSIRYEQSAERGVFADFTTELPLEITLPNGQRRTEWVRSADHAETFSFTLPQAPTRISIATGSTLATDR
ncbi:MAG: M1 family aminopeptidase [Bryobacteraceae bacterium]